MGDILYLLGPHMNYLARASSVTSSSSDTNLGLSYLYDYDPATRFKFGAIAADDHVTTDLNILPNGDMEDWAASDAPDNWVDESNGSGIVSEETSIVHGGSSAVKLDSAGASNEAIVTRTIEVVSGQGMTLSGWIRGDGSNATTIRVRNLHTGYYLTSGGAWQSGTTNFGSVTSATYTEVSQSFTVEAYSVSKYFNVDLWIEIMYAASANAGYVDDFTLWPHWDFASIHGHNLGSNIVVTARSSTDNFSGSDVEEFTLSRTLESPHTIWSKDSALITNRYARLKFAGTNLHDAIELNEALIGDSKTLSFREAPTYPINYTMPQISFGEITSNKLNLSQHEMRRYGFEFRNKSLTEHREFLQLMREAEFGRVPAVLVPNTDDGVVMFGHIRPSTNADTIYVRNGRVYIADFVFQEEGFGVKTT